MVELHYVDRIIHVTVRNVLKKNELKTWKAKEWVIPPESNSAFVAGMEGVLDVLISLANAVILLSILCKEKVLKFFLQNNFDDY